MMIETTVEGNDSCGLRQMNPGVGANSVACFAPAWSSFAPSSAVEVAEF